MKKISLIAASLIVSVSLNAATVATLNGKNISDTEINEAFAPVLRGQDFKNLPEQQKKALINEYIAQQLFLEDAKKQNLEKDSLYKEELEKVKDAVLLKVYQEKLFSTIKIDSSKVKAYYEQNKNEFVKPARAKARHILVESEKEAKDIISQLSNLKGKALEDKFAEIARERSIDPGSATQGGELGWFDQSNMVKPFTDAAFSLKNGEMTKIPVKTNFGYHIILKENSQAKEQVKFDEVKKGIENRLKLEELQKLMAEKGRTLFQNSKVEYK
ncbi:peptidylprolyl isomerase [Campylobacter cuniculorum]|uniref:peptidylprolyl isomerase n=2 Tax=Campylobacter cuniculorum TaxID=374106 RepID=A0A1W6BVW8_9BACT|nr:peptidylprolyl isomerase [Campylobacter cuniculorum]ARJ56238.1 SurA-like chaperone / peptidyl-prolyl cis-trans isomerase [Campylobacter cuniculorum DSM 23162 = LMG 24588]QOR03729.1 peptidylprolyl isomerase [Campylobacter cuniculorum]